MGKAGGLKAPQFFFRSTKKAWLKFEQKMLYTETLVPNLINLLTIKMSDCKTKFNSLALVYLIGELI